MRLIGLIVSMGIVLYLVTSVINKQSKPEESNTNLLDKPAEVRTEVNRALDAAEKARQNALTQPKN
jgi:hypothetical protein